MEENKKGMNVIYPVLGIATLVVAIIGATFAYFSAERTADLQGGTIAEAAGLVLDVKSVTYDPTFASTGSNIVPLNLRLGDTEGKDTVDQFDLAMTNKCRDSLGNNICEVYKISVTNQSESNTVQVRGTLSLTSNATNMHWMVVKATSTTTSNTVGEGEGAVTTQYEVLNTATRITATEYANINAISEAAPITIDVTETSETVPDGEGTKTVTTYSTTNTAKSVSLAGGATETFYVVVWLEEMGTAQEAQDATGNYGAVNDETGEKERIERTYSGTVSFSAVDANGFESGVTATFLS